MRPEDVSAWNRAAWQSHLPPEMPLDRLDVVAGQTLPRTWGARWDEAPDAIALVDLAPGGSTLTRGDLQRHSARLAAGLRRLGVRPGDRVLMSAGASPTLILLHLAALRLGAVVVPVNTAYRERELAHIVRDCQPALAVLDDAERAQWVRQASERGAALPVVDPSADASLPVTDGGSDDTLDATGPEDMALIVYTSGTTGAPKGATLTHGNLLAGVEILRLAWRWTADDGLILALPLFHIHGLGVGLHGSLLTGARILLLPRFDPQGVLHACGRSDATLFFGVPTMWVRLLDHITAHPEDGAALASLRLIVSGSAPLSPAVFHEIEARCGQPVLERYGMSETIMLISNPYEGERRPGTVGRPLPAVEIRIMVGERAATDDEIGEIQVRGPNVFAGYWQREEATRQAFTADGWFRTGDLAARSRDGYVTIAGRASELIITGGYNVYPREVEDVLAEHPAIAEAAVVGVPSREWGEEVVAFLVAAVPGETVSDQELVAWCQDRLANYKRPRHFTFADQLPRNALGKLVRSNLRIR